MGPGHFVGITDWRSAVLAAIFTLFWLVWLGRGWLRSPWFWVALVAGAVLFPFSIAWVQVPIQQALSAFWTGMLDASTIQRYILLIGLPSLLVASVVQEGAKLMVAIGALRLSGRRRYPLAGLAIGAAAGAGYGGIEAFWVFNQIFLVDWSWAMVDLNGPVALLGFVERFFAIPLHIGVAALSAYGYSTGRTLQFLLLAIFFHTVANFGVLLLQARLIGLVEVEVWVAVLGIGAIGLALWLRRFEIIRDRIDREEPSEEVESHLESH